MTWNILIVDDEKEIREILKEYISLEFKDAKISIVENADEASKLLKEKQFHIIMLDIVMPGMDAFEFLKEVKKLNSLIQVIMITGNSTLKRVLEAIEHGADDYLMKPFSTEEVKKILHCSFDKIGRWRSAFKNSL
ncbi:response regulator [Marinitoga sp. 1138]|uniref:response regulator n=1 Tax=Marinitoga sp. 1138 TaxID=1643334 RepID=UPI00158693A5|nr:response regulator [Marinitoga sp. 1138]